jgi:hypothetical protein
MRKEKQTIVRPGGCGTHHIGTGASRQSCRPMNEKLRNMEIVGENSLCDIGKYKTHELYAICQITS